MRRLLLSLIAFAALGYGTYRLGGDSASLAHRRLLEPTPIPSPQVTPLSLAPVPSVPVPSVPVPPPRVATAHRVAPAVAPISGKSSRPKVVAAPGRAVRRFAQRSKKPATPTAKSALVASGKVRLAAVRPGAGAKSVEKRWVRGLSGPSGRPRLYQQDRTGMCKVTVDYCGMPRNTAHEAHLTGVVIDADSGAAGDHDVSLEGRVKAGHYAERTPAVYLK